MGNQHGYWVAALFGSTLACVVACGSSSSNTSNPGGTAGASGSGAAGQSGGAGASGSAGSSAGSAGSSAGSAGSSAGSAGSGAGGSGGDAGMSGSAGTSGTAGAAGTSGGSGAGGADGGTPCDPSSFQRDCPPLDCNLVSGCVDNVCQYTPLTVCLSRAADGTFSPGIADVTVGDVTLHGNLGAFRSLDGTLCQGTTCITGGVIP